MSTVAVIDYGMGNLHSVAKAIEHVRTSERVIVSSDPDTLRKADRLVLPGVGAIRDCMGEIKRLGMDQVVADVIAQGKPLLGVCVGMQALMTHSEENNGVDCLNVFSGEVRYFGDDLKDAKGEKLKIPHMGWNQVHQVIEHPMWKGIQQDARFYFVHSYYVEPAGPDYIAASSEYGLTFTSAITKENIFAVQFHPEKSQHAGLKLYENFLNWDI